MKKKVKFWNSHCGEYSRVNKLNNETCGSAGPVVFRLQKLIRGCNAFLFIILAKVIN